MITFVAGNDTMGDGVNPETMDYFMGRRFPWLSLAIPKLREMGHDVEAVSWQNKNIDWSSKSFAVVGPVWGYHKHTKDFEAWLILLQRNKVVIYNSAKFIHWNFKKTYLLDLQKCGINTPPTIIVDPNSKQTLQDMVEQTKKQWGTEDIIIKGVADGGAFGYKHIKHGAIDEHKKHFIDLKSKNDGAIVQPFLPEISRTGEYSFVFFNEKLSHGFLKVATRNEERIQLIYNGRSFHFKDAEFVNRGSFVEFRPDAIAPSQEEILSAQNQAIETRKKLWAFLQSRNIPSPLYARIDGAMSNGRFLVMEIEGIEPYMELNESMKANPNNNAVDNYVYAIDDAYDKTYH